MTALDSSTLHLILPVERRQKPYNGKGLLLCGTLLVSILLFGGFTWIIFHNNLKYLKRNVSYEAVQTSNEYKLVCYYNFPEGNSKGLQPVNIDPFLCTHIVVAFATIKNGSVNVTDFQKEILKSLVLLKQQNGNLKIILSVGGAGNDNGFSDMVLTHKSRKVFIASIVYLVRLHYIDGVDLDWEFPNENQRNREKMHFTQLLEEFRMVINKQHKHKFLLSVAVAAPAVIVDNSYYVNYINDYADFINIMTYDFHFYSKLTPFTGFNSPLYESQADKGYFSTLNINYTSHYWVAQGMSKEKIMIGLPTYAHTFWLTNRYNNALYAPAQSFGHLGSGGFADHADVCKFLHQTGVSQVFDNFSQSSYAVKGHEWVSYENEGSLSYKAKFIVDNGFGGAMIYSLNADDYGGVCDLFSQKHSFPLISKVSKVLNGSEMVF